MQYPSVPSPGERLAGGRPPAHSKAEPDCPRQHQRAGRPEDSLWSVSTAHSSLGIRKTQVCGRAPPVSSSLLSPPGKPSEGVGSHLKGSEALGSGKKASQAPSFAWMEWKDWVGTHWPGALGADGPREGGASRRPGHAGPRWRGCPSGGLGTLSQARAFPFLCSLGCRRAVPVAWPWAFLGSRCPRSWGVWLCPGVWVTPGGVIQGLRGAKGMSPCLFPLMVTWCLWVAGATPAWPPRHPALGGRA